MSQLEFCNVCQEVWQCGGIENFIMNVYRNIDRNEIQFDFLIHGEKENYFEEEIKKLGGTIYRVPLSRNYKEYERQIKRTFAENREKYHMIHIHCMYALSYLDAKMAKKCHMKNIIVHSHTSTTLIFKRKMIQFLLKTKLTRIADIRLACSEEAAKWMFSKKIIRKKQYKIIKNAIDVDKYKYNSETRSMIRKELQLEENLVIGHIGRLSTVKNHKFLLEIFKEIIKKKNEARLLLVGDGSLKNQIVEKAKELGIMDKVILLGNKENANELLQAMDVFVFPSLYEGFPLTVIEAQCTGVPCVLSDCITKQAKVTDLVSFLSLEENAEKWANVILDKENIERKDQSDFIKDKKYDINSLVEQIEKIYRNKGKVIC